MEAGPQAVLEGVDQVLLVVDPQAVLGNDSWV